MIDLNSVFGGGKASLSALKLYGFVKNGGGWRYAKKIADGQFELVVRVEGDKVFANVYDLNDGEEYFLHLVEEAEGGFVGAVRAEYEAALADIAKKCFKKNSPFRESVTAEVLAYAKKNYGAPPEYLWKKTPDCAALRAKNGKWFAVILTVEPSKLGLDGDKKLEIIDLLVPKGEPARIADGNNYFLGYHMNKQSWLTVPLDGRVNAEIICGFLDISYSLAMKR